MIKIELTFPKLEKKFKELEREVMLVLAAAMQTNRAMMFDKDGADNGKDKWEPLKWRSGRPLQATGTLRKSMAPQNDGIKPGHSTGGVVKVSGTSVSIGTSLLYAGLMNDGTTKLPGGVLKPVRAKALKIPLPQGKKAGEAVLAIHQAGAKRQLEKLSAKLGKAKSRKAMDKILDKMAELKFNMDHGRINKGEKFIFRKSVKIPARPMNTVTDLDKAEWSETVANFIASRLNE